MNELNHPLDANFAYSLVLFIVGITVSAILIGATYVITRGAKFKGPVYADISRLAMDRLILNVSTSILVLMECLTLLWDNLSYHQFPLLVRWPVDTLAVGAIGFSALRLITQYVKIHNEINNGGSVCPRTGYKCAAKPMKYVQIDGKTNSN